MTNTGRSVTDERRTDTRQQIRIVAMELFAEQGYDKTSLREIAERLGVTKAAVYYHFRTKEEIVGSLFDDQLAGMDEIVAWGRTQPPGPQRSRDLVERYAAHLAGSGVNPHMVRFLQENQTAVKSLTSAAQMRARFVELTELLAEPDASVTALLKTRLALVAVHFGTFAKDDLPGTQEERRAAARQVALELIGAAAAEDGMNSQT
ncbi:TetR/AcrR family transcriptional regulator [Pseudonocardia sp. CA-107938]|uniref:TetR/AcrR family transcriptional regulator n=1 Tax=Pseudonocardia sp. CA-107938 TaxID=3240021 RepID=UPI003D8D0B24